MKGFFNSFIMIKLFGKEFKISRRGWYLELVNTPEGEDMIRETSKVFCLGLGFEKNDCTGRDKFIEKSINLYPTGWSPEFDSEKDLQKFIEFCKEFKEKGSNKSLFNIF